MNKKPATKAEVIKLINLGTIVKSDTSEGYITIKRRIKGIFETKVFTNGAERPEVLTHHFEGLLKILSEYDEFYIKED